MSTPHPLQVVSNAYGDAQIVGDVTAIPFEDAVAFLREVVASADRGVWLRVPFTERGVRLVTAAWELGFTRAHSARGGFVTLQCWRRPTPNPTPFDAFTDVGAVAIVVDARGRVVAVRERFGSSGRWGLPGGHVDPGEGFAAAAVREAWEETGVRCVALGVVGQRHLPRLPPLGAPAPGEAPPARVAAGEQSMRFGTANLGVFVLCYALGGTGGPAAADVPLAFDPAELAEARWLEPQEFCAGAHEMAAVWVRCAEASGQLRVAAAAAAAAACGAPPPAPPQFLSRDSVLRLAHSSIEGASYEALCSHTYPAGTFSAAARAVGRAILGVSEQPEEAGGAAEVTAAGVGRGGALAAGAEASPPDRRLLPVLPRSLRCPVTWVWMGSVLLAAAGGAVLLRRALAAART